jgi:hypothetical protein
MPADATAYEPGRTVRTGPLHLAQRKPIGGRFTRLECVPLAVLATWVLVPLVFLIMQPVLHGGVFTGATGPDPVDDMQYLAWVRDSGSHIFSANLFNMTGGGHVFLQPMYLFSGILWRLGLSLQAAYLLWVPVAVIVVWLGFTLYARRMTTRPADRIAIVMLALFFAPPFGLVGDAGHLISHAGLTDVSVALQPWYAVHTTIALGLMPVVLLGAETIVSSEASLGLTSRESLSTTVGALIVAWLHSWQGEVLLLIMFGMALTSRPLGRGARLLMPMIGCAAPLGYAFALTHVDRAWRILEANDALPGLVQIGPLLMVMGPLIAAAVAGLVKRRSRSVGEHALSYWPLAAFVVYILGPEFPPHALQGVTLPLAVLAVRGWPRGKLAVALGLTAVELFTLPGLLSSATSYAGWVRGERTLFFQTADEHAALVFLEQSRRSGGVLAPYPLSLEVPAFTDRAVWDGHWAWTPDPTRPAQAAKFYAGHMTPAHARAFIDRTAVTWVIAECPGGADEIRSLGNLVTTVHRFGCVDVARVV